MLPAVLLAAVYLIWAPPSADLAAQTFRTDLFEPHGLRGLVQRLVRRRSTCPATACCSRRWPPSSGSAWSARSPRSRRRRCSPRSSARITATARASRSGCSGLGSATNLFTGRLTFALGTALALGGCWPSTARRLGWAAALRVLTAAPAPSPACSWRSRAASCSSPAGRRTAWSSGPRRPRRHRGPGPRLPHGRRRAVPRQHVHADHGRDPDPRRAPAAGREPAADRRPALPRDVPGAVRRSIRRSAATRRGSAR